MKELKNLQPNKKKKPPKQTQFSDEVNKSENPSSELFREQLEPRDYHVSIGMAYRTQNTDTEEMVREAELRMYEDKAKYYQNKEKTAHTSTEDEYLQAKTGILEIDAMLSILKESYNGIYCVSLDTDRARRLLMPAYLGYNETEEHFSKLYANYISVKLEEKKYTVLLTEE